MNLSLVIPFLRESVLRFYISKVHLPFAILKVQYNLYRELLHPRKLRIFVDFFVMKKVMTVSLR
jgi:hypothetical protein